MIASYLSEALSLKWPSELLRIGWRVCLASYQTGLTRPRKGDRACPEAEQLRSNTSPKDLIARRADSTDSSRRGPACTVVREGRRGSWGA